MSEISLRNVCKQFDSEHYGVKDFNLDIHDKEFVIFVGPSGCGKSTLLNALLNEEKAIVSDIHGTTRDVIEDTINLQGITFRFIDTAGIRQTSDTIESLGIKRTFKKMEQSHIILWMIDSTDVKGRLEELQTEILPHCQSKKLIILFNKSEYFLGSIFTRLDN